ncbi:reticulon-4-interacting protein 1 homolog, mitochondrial [Schistocerca nitens]|uniref:reticulon-4-interacting protein 1 homolog, mitochondrial n=1 Tax=Schistocerca nitens TaxID=7011 RepID=UPI002118E412|nr:reticulon-4-interacting protein 1 homolog, mitochondrial [Schistocerca nitens]
MPLKTAVALSRLSRVYCFHQRIRSVAYYSTAPNIDIQETPETRESQCWQIHSYGGVEELKLSNLTRPPKVQKPDEVIVKVHAASVNPIDVAMLGGYGAVLLNKMRQVESCDFSTPVIEFPLTLGRDFCGTVEYKGLGVRHLSIGDEVWGVLPPHRQGSHAQRIATPSSLVQRKPRNLNRVEAASLLYTGVTAWSALKISGDLFLLPAHGRRVLVLGGSGGVGTVAVQLLKAWGTQVVATCATDAVPLVESLGADVVIDYTNPDAEMLIRKAGKYDIILDAAGLGADAGPGYADCLKNLSLSKYITLRSPLLKNVDEFGIVGGMLKNIAELVAPNVRTGLSNPTSSVRWGFFIPSTDAITEIGTLVGTGKIIPLVEKVYPFEEVPAAFDRMKTGHLRGKIVVDMDSTKQQSEQEVKSGE